MVNLGATFVHGNLGWHAQTHCAALNNYTTTGLSSIQAEYIAASTLVPVPDVCVTTWALPNDTIPASVNVCRIVMTVNTTSTSTTHMEAWFPDTWYGRFLGLGTAGISGCIDYPGLVYGTRMHFATIGSDAGHSGPTGLPLLNSPEVLVDFSYRATHIEVVIGKELTKMYYGNPHHHSYYMGCSQGGRQGFRAAEQFPDDFDGVLAGDPAINTNNLVGWMGISSLPFLTGKPGSLTDTEWALVQAEAVRQCDWMDGIEDGIIADPETCNFRPEALLCSETHNKHSCLDADQVAGLRKLYQPMYGVQGELLYPRFSPGAEHMGAIFNLTFRGSFPDFTLEWFRYGIYNDPSWDPSNFSIADIEFADNLNPANVSTWTGDLGAFKQRGGKLLTYHGTQDSLMPMSISSLQYAETALATGDMDAWYAYFVVPGMDHCANNIPTNAKGAWQFGQMGNSPHSAHNTSAYNALLAIVDWVEKGRVPQTITGMDNNGKLRPHCRYPSKSLWRYGEWGCYQV